MQIGTRWNATAPRCWVSAWLNCGGDSARYAYPHAEDWGKHQSTPHVFLGLENTTSQLDRDVGSTCVHSISITSTCYRGLQAQANLVKTSHCLSCYRYYGMSITWVLQRLFRRARVWFLSQVFLRAWPIKCNPSHHDQGPDLRVSGQAQYHSTPIQIEEQCW